MRFVPVSRAEGYDFPSSTFDVRGWRVKTALDREQVGRVDDILVDETGRPRFLDVDVGIYRKHVLVPLGHSRVDARDDVIWIDGIAREQLQNIPEYLHDPSIVSSDYEHRLGEFYRGVAVGTGVGVRAATEVERGGARYDWHASRRAPARPFARLSELHDYRVVQGDPDPRGWDLISADGHRIGDVSELIIDTHLMEATYLDADVDEKKLNLEAVDRHILVPVESVRVDRGRRSVVVDGLFLRDVGSVPTYGGLPITSDMEDQIQAAYRPVSRAAVRSDVDARTNETVRRFGDESRYVDRFYGSRRGSRGIGAGDTTMLSNVDDDVRIRLRSVGFKTERGSDV